jgi:nitrite reductase/ring-hydroxylating ferredoxin subunit/alkylhydroperoxidase/carboxymuconolactone decarboxylase family protein YurZ
MSDALDYLVKARPEAMGHYFSFLKDAGRHLDPRTRALISVITKVHAQTEAGFRQYLRRALRDGCRPVEILDALLMAFPALGLTKIVWAIDILLGMNLPGFGLEALNATGAWHAVGPAASFVPGSTVRVECDGRGLLVHRTAEELVVHEARCPHQRIELHEGAIDGGRIRCAKHEREFDPATGACVKNGVEPLLRLESRVSDGVLEVCW